jgi:hypothetical protein
MKTCGKKSKGKNLIEDIRKKIVSSHIKKTGWQQRKTQRYVGQGKNLNFPAQK